MDETVISGYKVTFRSRSYDKDEKPPSKQISIDEGVEAMRQWAEGAPMIMLRGSAYNTRGIESIEAVRTVAPHDPETRQRLMDERKIITEQNLKALLKERMGITGGEVNMAKEQLNP